MSAGATRQGRHARCDATADRIHIAHSRLIAYLADLLALSEIKKRELPHIHMHADTLFGGHLVVLRLYDHGFQLVYDVVGRRHRVGHMHIHAYDEIGCEILLHHIYREVVVDAAVVDIVAVDLNRLKHRRKSHRRADSVGEMSRTEHQFAAPRHIGGHTPERHEQIVEIAPALSGIGRKQLHVGEIHRNGGNET